MSFSDREIEIIKYIQKNGVVTISKIADEINVSYKTISQDLKNIKKGLTSIGVDLIRKPNIGVFFDGKTEALAEVISNSDERRIPNNQSERIQYLCFYILTKPGYFTIQDLSENLYISKTTIEKDIKSVYEIFEYFYVTIEKIKGKGSFVNLMEQEKRKMVLDLIYYFWGENWEVTKQSGMYLNSIQGIPRFVDEFIDISIIKKIDKILQNYLTIEKIELTDTHYQSLLLHILITVERIKSGFSLNESKKSSINKLYDNNIKILIKEIENSFEIKISESELDNIKLYLNINNSNNKDFNEERMLFDERQIIERIIKEVIPFGDDKMIIGLVSHISHSILRINNQLSILNPFTSDVQKNFPRSFEEAIQIKNRLDNFFHIQIPKDEVAYIAVHIQAFKEREKEENKQIISVLVVCSSGKGTAQLLAARIRRLYPELVINRISSIQNLKNMNRISEDLIISTVPLNSYEKGNVVTVSPILTKNEIEEINIIIEKISNSRKFKRNREFSRLIYDDFIFLNESFNSKEDIIQFISERLVVKNYVRDGFLESVLQREKIASTSFGKIATPHGESSFVNKSIIVFLGLKKPIIWGNEKVKTIFLLCMQEKNSSEYERIYDELLDIVDDIEQKSIKFDDLGYTIKYLKEGS